MSGKCEPSTGSAPPLGPAALVLVKQELGALPSQQQQKYWQLADVPYDPAELSQLVEHYLEPYIATRHVTRGLRSGRGREAQVLVPVKFTRIQQHYPVLAPVVLQLHDQVKREEQQEQQRQQKQQQEHQQQQEQQQQQKQQKQKQQSQHPQQQHMSSSTIPAATPSSVRLLLVLRCLFLWGRHQAQEQQLPSLLQSLLVRARAAAGGSGAQVGAEAMEDSDVEEVVDLTNEHEDDEVPQEELEAFLAGECEVMLVREVRGKQQQRQRVVQIKPDPEAAETAANVSMVPFQQQEQVNQKRKSSAVAVAGLEFCGARSVKKPRMAGKNGPRPDSTASAKATACRVVSTASAKGRRAGAPGRSRAAAVKAAAAIEAAHNDAHSWDTDKEDMGDQIAAAGPGPVSLVASAGASLQVSVYL